MSKVVKLGTQLVPDAQQGRRCHVGNPGPISLLSRAVAGRTLLECKDE